MREQAVSRWTPIAVVLMACTLSTATAATPWEEYLQKPSPERASRVSSRSYTNAAVDSEQKEFDLMLLEVEVLSREPEAVRLAFRFRATADGHVGELLDIMLGRLIRSDAPLFLR